jgi:hypothetical protein
MLKTSEGQAVHVTCLGPNIQPMQREVITKSALDWIMLGSLLSAPLLPLRIYQVRVLRFLVVLAKLVPASTTNQQPIADPETKMQLPKKPTGR